MAFGPVSIGGSSYVLPPATKESLGGVIVGDDLTVDEQGKINLPVATATTLGGIKLGKGLEIRADGTASIDAYNTAETDALLNKLQEQLNNIGSLTSRQVYCQRAATNMTIPDEVDYVVLTNSDCTTIDDTCAVVARGGSAYATYDGKTDRIKFGADGTLTLTITSGYYLAMSNVLGFRYEVSAAFPCLIGSIVVHISQWNDNTSDPVPDGTDFITFSTNTVANAREIPINRGQSYAYKNGLSFKTDGTIVTTLVSGHGESFKVNCYKYMTPSEWHAHMTELQSAQADADALNLDQDYRLTLLELGASESGNEKTE